MKKWLLVLLISVFVAGCSEFEQVSNEKLQGLRKIWKEPKVAIWYYQGTDDKYHYFKYLDLGINNKYKVSKSEMRISNTFLFTKKQKEWRAMPWGPHVKKVDIVRCSKKQTKERR